MFVVSGAWCVAILAIREGVGCVHREIDVFGALRPLWIPETEKKKAKEFMTRVWQHLPIPFQTFLKEEHSEIWEHFGDDPTADTYGLNCVTGHKPGPDGSEAQPEKPVRVWTSTQPLWSKRKKYSSFS